jgi:molybdopterin molybdotransferase
MGPAVTARIERLDLDDALGRWLAAVLPVAEEAIAAPFAAGRVLARPVSTWRPLPALTTSAVDGYAVRAADLAGGRALRVVGEVWAGRRPNLRVGAGEAAYVATGAPVPDGADAMLPVELVRAEETASGDRQVLAVRAVEAGANVRVAGEDLAAEALALDAGERLTPDRLPLFVAAAAGRAAVVARRPRLAILPTGDELVEAGRAPADGQVVEAIGVAIAAAAGLAGATASVAPPLPDDRERLTTAVAAAAREADLVVTVGAASVGTRDHAAAAVIAAGGEIAFHGVRLRPGTPAFGGWLGNAVVLGLPGNPVAALTAWELLGRPAVSRLLGTAAPPRLEACLAVGLRRRPVSDERYLRAGVWAQGGRLWAAVYPRQSAGMLVPLARTNALVRHPAGREELEAGELVEVRPTGDILSAPPPWLDARDR